MDHHSSAPYPDSAAGASRTPVDVEAQRERLRAELLAAAEEEAASILEDARREITVTARRAHRDLLLIRAQLRLCGIEPGNIGTSGLDPSYLEPETAIASPDASIPVVTDRRNPDVPHRTDSALAAAGPAPARSTQRAALAGVIVLFVAVAAAGWRYLSSPTAATATVAPTSAAGNSATGLAAATGTSTARPPSPAPAPPPRVVLQTTRPVWMRVEVDGNPDVGRIYPAGDTQALNPRQTLLIRAGDAGAVMLAVNGGPMTAFGPAGQAVTRRLAIDAHAAAPANAERVVAPPAIASPANAAGAPVPGASAERTPPPVAPQATPSASTAQPANAVTTPAPAPPAPTAATVPARPADVDQRAVMAGHSLWLDAYARGDQRTLATLTVEGFSMRDERASRNGIPVPALAPAQISDVRVDVAGAGAVLTARLRSSADGVVTESLLSEVWVRRDMQRWGLMGVRITPVDNLPSAVR